MMASDPLDAYKNTQINTASREQILLMLYDGAIKFMKQSREAMENNNYEKSHNKNLKAQDIVTELMASLDMDVMGETGDNLYRLYDFTLHSLVQSNVKKDPQFIEQALEVMEDLYSAWDEIINEKGMTYEKAKRQTGRSNLAGATSQTDSRVQGEQSSSSSNQSSSDGSKSSQSDESPYGDISFTG